MSSNICALEPKVDKGLTDGGVSAKGGAPAQKVDMNGKHHAARRSDAAPAADTTGRISEQALGALKKFKAHKDKAPAKKFPRTPLHKRMQSGDL